jgi:hypothetical protein
MVKYATEKAVSLKNITNLERDSFIHQQIGSHSELVTLHSRVRSIYVES